MDFKNAVGLWLTLNCAIGWALDRNGQEEVEGEKQGLVSLYLFNETTGPYLDSAENGPPLNLEVATDAETEGAITRSPGKLLITGTVPNGAIATVGPATKIIDQCRTSNEITLEAYIRTTRENQNGPARILTLSSDSQNRNFTLGHSYDGKGHFRLRLRTTKNGRNGTNRQPQSPGGSMITSNDPSDTPQHLVITRNKEGLVRIFVDRALVTEDSSNALGGDFSNWDETMRLAIGNELTDTRKWKGELHLLAVFCRAKTLEEIAGDVAFISLPTITPQPLEEVSKEQELALRIYKRLTGIRTPIDAPIIAEMAEKIKQGELEAAAALATDTPHFYNFLVRDFAAKMSTREESVKTPLNDFIATTIGVVRDEISAKQLLTGNFTYVGGAGKTAVPSNSVNDFITSNNHYLQLENQGYDLAASLERRNGQKLIDSQGQIVDNPDPAGLLTTRAFMEAHAVAGTNRRLVEFTFRQFLCTPMERWADATSSDNHVGRDIDRYPGGNNGKYQTTCKSCHSNMDGFRGAFARFDFDNGLIKNALFFPNGDGEMEMQQNPPGISAKYNQNAEVFLQGHRTENSTWINNAVRGANAKRFGWRTASGAPLTEYRGSGVKQFGEMVANSKRFSQCMAQRVFAATCGREITDLESEMVEDLAGKFENENHNLKRLFQIVAGRSECLGLDVQGGQ